MLNKNYCLITGASEGFGKALALECASRKMHLILVALPGPELYYLSDFIKRNYGVDVIAIEKSGASVMVFSRSAGRFGVSKSQTISADGGTVECATPNNCR